MEIIANCFYFLRREKWNHFQLREGKWKYWGFKVKKKSDIHLFVSLGAYYDGSSIARQYENTDRYLLKYQMILTA